MSEEQENVTGPVKTFNPVMVQPHGAALTTQDLDTMLENAEKMATLYDRIRKVALSKTSLADWIDEGGKPYLQRGGCDKVGAFIGASYTSPTYEVERSKDENGDLLIIYCSLMILWQRRELPEIGSASSRDPFFGVRGGKFLPLSEIDQTDLRKKSLTNALNRGIKGILGLSLTWEEVAQITENRVTREKVIAAGQGVNFSKGTQGGKTDASPETADKRSKVWKMLLEICGDEAAASARLVKLTVWTAKDNKVVAGKAKITDVSEAMMGHLLPKVQKEYDEFMGGRQGEEVPQK
jgi:hypothetical protein